MGKGHFASAYGKHRRQDWLAIFGMMPIQTSILGIHQSDVVIRSALEKGLENLRAKPWLLDYVFASLPQDELTANRYGQATVQRAKEWFLQNKVSIFMSTRTDKPTWPALSIKLASSNETENTLGDVHYEPREDSDLQWPALYGPFNAVSYDPFTGYLTLPDDVSDTLYLSYGQLVIDGNGLIHPIEEVIDVNVVKIETALTTSFQNAVVKAQPPAYVAEVESLNFAETYHIGVHVGGEQEQLTWLHSIVVFILLAYKETLLEARNFERSTIQSSDFMQNPAFDEEVVYSRYVTITGTVRQIWPKSIKQKITGIQPDVLASPVGELEPIVDLDADGLAPITMTIQDPRTLPYVYYGAAANPGTINAAFAQGLSGRAAQATVTRGILYNTGSGPTLYAWYIFPSAMGEGITADNFIDGQTSEVAGFTKITTIQINGVNYDVWRSTQPGLGIYPVLVNDNV